MITMRQRLKKLLAEATRQTVHFEKQYRRREQLGKILNVTIAVGAVLVGTSSVAELPASVTVILATVLTIAIGLNLALGDTQVTRDLHHLANRWRRHQAEASRLLARDDMRAYNDTSHESEKTALDLEFAMSETRTDSLLHRLGHPAAAASGPDTPAPGNHGRQQT